MKQFATVLVAASVVLGPFSVARAGAGASVAVTYTVTSIDPSQPNPSMSPITFFSSATWSDAPPGPGYFIEGYFDPNLQVTWDPNGSGSVTGQGGTNGDGYIQASASNAPGQSFGISGYTIGDYTLSAYSRVTLVAVAGVSQVGSPGTADAQICFQDTQCFDWSTSGGNRSFREVFTFTNDTDEGVGVDLSATVSASSSGVPEPSQTVLMMSALGAMAWRRRRWAPLSGREQLDGAETR